jgi:DNA-binding MarR family transcriptional regulator
MTRSAVNADDIDNERIIMELTKEEWIKRCASQVEEPVDYVKLLQEAEQIVRSKPTWKRFIDGTPLANDIAVWMADFVKDHAAPCASDTGAFEKKYSQIVVSDLQDKIAALEAELVSFRLERQIRQSVEKKCTELQATIAQQAEKLKRIEVFWAVD